jgi:DNA-binding XRE family transcriptional regulator
MKAAAKAAAERKKAEERDAKARKLAEERQQALAAKADAAEQGLYDLEEEDPAMNEREADDAAAKVNEKPPEH